MAFIFAIFTLFISIIIAGIWSYAEGMAPAPKYTYTPLHILIGGGLLAVFIASTYWHWLFHIGW